MHKAAPYAELWHIVPPYGEFSDAPPEVLQHHMVRHTSIKACYVFVVKVVNLYRVNHMICCGQKLAN